MFTAILLSLSKLACGGTWLKTLCITLSVSGVAMEIYDSIFNPAVYATAEFLAKYPPIEYVEPGYLDNPLLHVYANGWETYVAKAWSVNLFCLFMTPANWPQGILLLLLIQPYPIPSIIPYNYPIPIV